MQLKNKIFFSIIGLSYTVQSALANAKVDEKSVIVQKFSVAIGLVVFFSALLYGILYFYKKVFNKNASNEQTIKKEVPLTSPSNMNEAISVFLEKTKTNK